MLLPSPYSRWLPSPRWLRLGRERDTIYNNYDRKFAAWSTHIQGLSFVNTFPSAKNVGNTDCHHDKPAENK